MRSRRGSSRFLQRKHPAWIQYSFRVERLLQEAHDPDLIPAPAEVQMFPLFHTDSVFGRYRPAESRKGSVDHLFDTSPGLGSIASHLDGKMQIPVSKMPELEPHQAGR